MKLTLDELKAKLRVFDIEAKTNRDKIIVESGWSLEEYYQPATIGIYHSLTKRVVGV